MPIKYLICIIYAKNCPEYFSGTVCPTWMIFGMWIRLGPKMRMVTFMEVKGHQRSNGVNYMCYGYHIWSKEALMQAENDDLDGGQRSSEVKWGKLCAMATIFGQKKPWCKLRMMMTLIEVKGHQRSNEVNYVLWLPVLIKRSADASWEWWWPW